MPESDLLLTIAEVAIAFGGFASLVGILGQRSSRDDARVLGVRLRAMILFSLLAVAFSLLPEILGRYGMSATSVWRFSSALGTLALGSVATWVGLSIRRLLRLDIRRRPVVRVIGAILFPSIGAGLLLFLSNALFVPPDLLAAIYVTALGVLLFLAGFAFTLILFSFLPSLDSQ